jgi:HK97 family phage major capsid protein
MRNKTFLKLIGGMLTTSSMISAVKAEIERRANYPAGSCAWLFADRGGPRVACAIGPRIYLDANRGDGSGDVTEVELKNLMDGLANATKEVKDWAKTAKGEMESLSKLTKETKAGSDKALAEMNTKVTKLIDDFEAKTGARIADIEQKMARRGPNGLQMEEVKSAGQMVIENENVKSTLLGGAKRGAVHVSMERKNITSAVATVGSGVSPSTSLVVADRQPIVGLPLRKMTIRDLLTPGTTVSSNIEYTVETGTVPPTVAAATVSEGQLKPQGDLTYNLKSSPVRTIASIMKASRQILDDAPQLQSYIDGRLRYGLELVEEDQLLKGDGTGNNLLGIIPQATAFVEAFSPSAEQQIDKIRLAMLQATAVSLFPATGSVLHPQDWARIETLKDTLGRYIIGQPQGSIQPTLWNLPVVETIAMTINTFLTGAFRLGAQIFDRMSIEVLISTEDADNFVRNLITIRGEERLALAVYRPSAFIYGALS